MEAPTIVLPPTVGDCRFVGGDFNSSLAARGSPNISNYYIINNFRILRPFYMSRISEHRGNPI